MSLSYDEMLRVMAFADDELDAEERDEVAAWIARDEDAHRAFVALSDRGYVPFVGEWAEKQPDSVDDIAGLVMKRIDVSVSTIPTAPPSSARQLEPSPKLVSLEAARAKKRSRVMMAAGAALALAAGTVLAVRPFGGTASSVGASVAGEGVSVDTIEAPSEVSVFYVEGQDSAKKEPSSVVIWVEEAE